MLQLASPRWQRQPKTLNVASGWVASVRVFLNTHAAAGSWRSSNASPSPLNPEVKDLIRAQKENYKGCKKKSGGEHSALRPGRRTFVGIPGKGAWLCWLFFLLPCCASAVTRYELPGKLDAGPLGPAERQFHVRTPWNQSLTPAATEQCCADAHSADLLLPALDFCGEGLNLEKGNGTRIQVTPAPFNSEFDDEPVENSVRRLSLLVLMGLIGTCIRQGDSYEKPNKKRPKNKKEKHKKNHIMTKHPKKQLRYQPKRWAEASRMCGRQRLPTARLRYRRMAQKLRSTMLRRSSKVLKHRRISRPHGMYILDPNALKLLSPTLEGLKQCLNEGGNQEIQNLARLLSLALLQDQPQPTRRVTQKPSDSWVETWKGQRYQVDSTGWWTWLGNAELDTPQKPNWPLARSL